MDCPRRPPLAVTSPGDSTQHQNDDVHDSTSETTRQGKVSTYLSDHLNKTNGDEDEKLYVVPDPRDPRLLVPALVNVSPNHGDW